jgi:hypothetical protein
MCLSGKSGISVRKNACGLEVNLFRSYSRWLYKQCLNEKERPNPVIRRRGVHVLDVL